MNHKNGRVKQGGLKEKILDLFHTYAYAETLIIVSLYLFVGYLIDPNDICLLDGEVSYILILLAVITLFHGFENGILAVSIIAAAMWFAYESFQYIEFLVTLMMTMIFSEFHYYWTQKIKKAEVETNYKAVKLDELSKAFYTLKISHDQLEKNYIVKPMSIRNSIESIMNMHKKVQEDDSITDKNYQYYADFLSLLEKSFNVQSALALYLKDSMEGKLLKYGTANMVLSSNCEEAKIETIFQDYLIDKAIERQIPIYVSDKRGEPSAKLDRESNYLAAIPSVQEGKVVSVLVIRRMPFMSFNREVLTSISILLDYFSIEVSKSDLLATSDELYIVPDLDFRYEFARLQHIYAKYQVDSIVLVLRMDNELQATRVYEKIVKMLRSLDMVTMIENNNFFYVILMFPLHDKAAALGFHNRLLNTLDEEQDKKFNFMTFNMSKIELLNKYLREDYGQ